MGSGEARRRFPSGIRVLQSPPGQVHQAPLLAAQPGMIRLPSSSVPTAQTGVRSVPTGSFPGTSTLPSAGANSLHAES